MPAKKNELEKQLGATVLSPAGTKDAVAVLEFFNSGTKPVFAKVDSAEAAARIQAQRLSAASADDLFGGSTGLPSGKDYVGRPFMLTSVEWQDTDLPTAATPFYAVLHIIDLQGEVKAITCGANTVVQKVAMAVVNGWLPRALKITQGKQLANGGYALDIVDAPEIAPFK
jgi:hypothetical protein